MLKTIGQYVHRSKVLAQKKQLQALELPRSPQGPKRSVSSSLAENMLMMREHFYDSSDFVQREFVIAAAERRACLFYIDGLVSSDSIDNAILKPLMLDSRQLLKKTDYDFTSVHDIVNRIVISNEILETGSLEEITGKILSGDTVVMVDGEDSAFCCNTKGWERRSVSEPATESVIRGPRQGFTESIRTNTALVRRIVRDQNLRFESLVIGERTHTNTAIAYVEGLANPNVVQIARDRLRNIKTDSMLSSGYIDEYLGEGSPTLFSTTAYTERPDVAAAKLLEGRVAIFLDGSPFVVTAPKLFIENFISSEDYTMQSFIATFLRGLRMVCFFISLFFPSLFLALSCFSQEMVPTPLLFTMAASIEGLPFSSSLELVIMLIIFEILKEAGVRLPKPVGSTVSLVSALVMGQSAVEAGLVGAPIMIVVSITSVSAFAIPALSDTIGILRWFLLILTAIFGGIGTILGAFCIVLHLLDLDSFGVPFCSPISPLELKDLKDTFVRVPLWRMRTRPEALEPQDAVRNRMSPSDIGASSNEREGKQ